MTTIGTIGDSKTTGRDVAEQFAARNWPDEPRKPTNIQSDGFGRITFGTTGGAATYVAEYDTAAGAWVVSRI